MIGRRNILAMLGLAPAALVSGGGPELPPMPATATGWAARGMNGSSLFGDAIGLGVHDEIDRRKKSIHALKKLRAAGYRETNHLYNRCECIESRKATSPAIKRLLQQDYYDRMQIEREQVNLDNLIVRTLLPESIQEWL